MSPLWRSGHRNVHVASDKSESSFWTLLPTLQQCLQCCNPSPNAYLPCSIFSASPGSILHPRQVPLELTLGLDGRGWLASGREAISSLRGQLFPSALGALYAWFRLSTVSEQTMPIIYLFFFLIHYVMEDVLWLLILCVMCFYSKLQHQQLVGFPCWYLLQVKCTNCLLLI